MQEIETFFMSVFYDYDKLFMKGDIKIVVEYCSPVKTYVVALETHTGHTGHVKQSLIVTIMFPHTLHF